MSYVKMEITMEEAIKLLLQIAPYVDQADINIIDEEFSISDGVVYQLVDKPDLSLQWEEIAHVNSLPVNNIESFLKKFIEFSEKTLAIVDPMILNTPDADYHWVVNARACCGIAMVRYRSRKGLLKDIKKDSETLLKLGFKFDHDKDWQYVPDKS